MSPQPLPTKETFLFTIETIEHCDICHDTFSSTHVPVRTPCQHIFGSTCLTTWANSSASQSNTCPTCRAPLFSKPSRTPNFAPGADPNDPRPPWLDNVTGRKCASSFVQCLWYHLSALLHKSTVFDTDLEEAVDLALTDMGNARAFKGNGSGRPSIQMQHMGAVREVAREIVKEQYAMEVWRELEEEGEVREWVRKMGEAVGWRLRGGSE